MSELSFRLSREGDVPELTRLWREVFGDDEDFISEFFRLLWRPEYCRVAEAEGKLAATHSNACLISGLGNGQVGKLPSGFSCSETTVTFLTLILSRIFLTGLLPVPFNGV